MKKHLPKLLLSPLLATTIFLCSAFTVLPKTDFELTVIAGKCKYVLRYPELDVYKGQIYLKGKDSVVERIYLDTLIPAIDATVTFTPNGNELFTFTKECGGSEIDKNRMLKDIELACKHKAKTVRACWRKIMPGVTITQLKAQTKLRAEFSTLYPYSLPERKHNIELACRAINGTFLNIGEELSFNETVGERTEERGYKQAKIILEGRFADGVGGGVCQVSTTLYNCALLAGLTVKERHPHSLSVSYVEPSFDAMVSSFSDLRVKNDTGGLIFIEAIADGEKITFRAYGLEPDFLIERISTIESEEMPGYDEIDDQTGELCGDAEEIVLTYPKPKITSSAYLITTKNGIATTVKLSRDIYAGIKGVMAKKVPARNAADCP